MKQSNSLSPVPCRSFSAQTWWRRHVFGCLLVLGIILRCVALNQPLIDAHNIRQCQTAMATSYLRDQGGWPLSTPVNWFGDAGVRLLQELPIYNYLVIGFDGLVGRLDMSGKLVTVLLWALSFLIFDRILRRFLAASQRHWACFLFAVSPLSVFFGQAFMPEMLVMALGFGTILAFLRYQDTDRLGWLTLVVVLESLGLVVKATESAHLVALMGLLVLTAERHRALLRLRYWVALIFLVVVAQYWRAAMAEGTSSELVRWLSLGGALGKFEARFSPIIYARIFFYIALLVATPVGLFLAVVGFVRCWRTRREVVLMAWVASLVGYYLAWGPWAASSHSYYNLPSLPVVCAFFGFGASNVMAWSRVLGWRRLARRGLAAGVILLVLAASLAGSVVLFKQDRNVYEAALRLRELNQDPRAMALVVYNHNRYALNHGNVPTLAYYAHLRTWCHHGRRNSAELAEILEKVQWVVVVKYTADQDPWFRGHTWYSNRPKKIHDIRQLGADGSLDTVEDTTRYAIFRIKHRN